MMKNSQQPETACVFDAIVQKADRHLNRVLYLAYCGLVIVVVFALSLFINSFQ